jgi:hypothetical protein
MASSQLPTSIRSTNHYNALAWRALFVGRLDVAAHSLAKARTIRPALVATQRNGAHILLLKGQLDEAIAAYRAVRTLRDPGDVKSGEQFVREAVSLFSKAGLIDPSTAERIGRSLAVP